MSRRSTTRPAFATTPASSPPTTSRARRTRCGRSRSATRRSIVLNDKQTYGFGVATTYKNAAKKLGIKVVGFKGWDAKQSSYEALANLDQGVGCAGRLPRRHHLQQRREADAGLKAVAPKVKLQMPDGFSDPSANGAVANGAYISVAGQPPKSLTGAGATFIKSFGKQIGTVPNPYSQYGAQAMQVMLAGRGGRRR